MKHRFNLFADSQFAMRSAGRPKLNFGSRFQRSASVKAAHIFEDSLESDEDQGRKISTNISNLIRPYYDPQVSLDEMHTIVSVGVLAWNLSLAKHQIGLVEIQDFCQKADIADAVTFTTLLQEFIQRKEDLLPDDTRLIVSWDIKKEHGQYQVMAATNFEP